MGDIVTHCMAAHYVIMSLERPFKACAHKQDWHSDDRVHLLLMVGSVVTSLMHRMYLHAVLPCLFSPTIMNAQ